MSEFPSWPTICSRRTPQWRLRSQSVPFRRTPLLMGIVNVTPDSFSDGGQFLDASLAVEHGLQLAAEGADLLDVGGESTRPFSQAVSEEEELRRVIPVVQELCRQVQVPVSIDTSKARVAAAALEAGAEVINDVTGLVGDERMLAVARQSGAGVCVMHMQGTPQTMQVNPTYADVVREVTEYLAARGEQLVLAGIQREAICLDPGIGFGKTHQHNLTLLAHCWQLHALGFPLLVGHSRKGFIGKLVGSDPMPRMQGTVGTALSLARQGVQLLRVHDVAAVRAALELFAATGGIDGCETQLA